MQADTLALVTEILRGALGSKVEIAGCEVANQHEDYLVLVLDLRRPEMRVSFKMAGPRAPYEYPFESTAYFHRLVAQRTSVPMPDILAVDASYRAYPWRYLLKTYLPGEMWVDVWPHLSPEELRSAYSQLGQAVAEIHRIEFPAFGTVAVDGTVRAGQAYFPSLLERIQRYIHEPGLLERMIDLLQANQALFAQVSPARLTHEDFHPYNVLFQQDASGAWRLATLLDFDKGWAGHNEIDLARMAFWDGMTGPGFWEAYTAVLPVDLLFQQRKRFYQLVWCFEYADNTPRHLADTNRLCGEFGLPRVERFEGS